MAPKRGRPIQLGADDPSATRRRKLTLIRVRRYQAKKRAEALQLHSTVSRGECSINDRDQAGSEHIEIAEALLELQNRRLYAHESWPRPTRTIEATFPYYNQPNSPLPKSSAPYKPRSHETEGDLEQREDHFQSQDIGNNQYFGFDEEDVVRGNDEDQRTLEDQRDIEDESCLAVTNEESNPGACADLRYVEISDGDQHDIVSRNRRTHIQAQRRPEPTENRTTVQIEESPLDFTADKLYRQFQSFYGCSREQHNEQLRQHEETHGENHHQLNQIFSDSLPPVLQSTDVLSPQKLSQLDFPTPNE
jgi:hypothetical protein